MKKIVLTMVLVTLLTVAMFALTGCTLQIETTDNSVSASVDGETTERVDSVIDWIKARIDRVFNSSDEGATSAPETTSTVSEGQPA